jgi:hypothetical protein
MGASKIYTCASINLGQLKKGVLKYEIDSISRFSDVIDIVDGTIVVVVY